MEYMETMKRSLFSEGYLARCEEGDEVGDKDANKKMALCTGNKTEKG
jgi:hypothetical protein